MKRRTVLWFFVAVEICGLAAAVTPEGIVYESDQIAEPASAWIKDRSTADHWNLWTREDQIEKKRSGGAVLASPVVKVDRRTPEEGAPPLHCMVRDLKAGWYQAFVSAPGRPLAYSLDGVHWFRHQGGELALGLFQAGGKPFELWVDDRYAAPQNSPGPAYFDYVRFVPTASPAIENLETCSPEPGVIEVCWTTTVPLPGGQVTLDDQGRQQRSADETEPLRNHRAVFRGLMPERTYPVQVVYVTPLCLFASCTLNVRAAPQPPAAKGKLSVPLAVVEPSEIPRKQWPVTIGMPFARGTLANPADLSLATADGRAVTLQAENFSRHSDGSVKWAVLSFLADSTRDADAGYRLEAGRPKPVDNLLRVTARDAGWTLTTPSRSVRIERSSGRLFLFPDRLPATLRLVDGEGKAWLAGPVDDAGVKVESNGPIRAVVKWSGLLTPEGGAPAKPEWGYLLRLTFWHGQPLVDVDVSLWCDAVETDFGEVRAWTMSIPMAAESSSTHWAIQDRDNRCRFGDATREQRMEHGDGFVRVADAGGEWAVGLPDFWQTYPYGFRVGKKSMDLLLLPELPVDTYRDQEGRAWYWRIYSWCRDGKYEFRAGQLVRRQARLWLAPVTDAPKLAAWLQHPLLPQATPEHLCTTGALGMALPPQSAGAWPDYESWFVRNFSGLQKNCRDNRTWGFMHYGDWYGERALNYGNNEYDLPWALAMQWMRTGNADYFWRGAAMARHYSSIDSVYGRPALQARGLCREHSFNHVGTPATPEELFMPLENASVKQYLEQYGRGMFRGAIDPQGHVFQNGNWITAAVLGDGFLRDEAVRVCDHQAAQLTRNFDFGIERAGGWPLINATGAYWDSGDPYYLNAARIMIERCLQRQDPATGGWLHKPPLSETGGEAVLGGKAFAVGILSFGILRYLEIEPRDRPDVRKMAIRGADWLMNEAWNPKKKGFRYISNCEKYRDTGERGLTALLNVELVAAAYEWTHDEKYRRFAHALLDNAFVGNSSAMGKGFTQGTRQTIFGLERLRRAEQDARPRHAVNQRPSD